MAQCINVVVLPGWKQQVLIHSWRTYDRLMVMVAVVTWSAAHQHELNEGVEDGVVLETAVDNELMHVTLALYCTRPWRCVCVRACVCVCG